MGRVRGLEVERMMLERKEEVVWEVRDKEVVNFIAELLE